MGFISRNDYAKWIVTYDTLTEKSRLLMRLKCDGFLNRPVISVLMPVYNPNPDWLRDAIESVRDQIYPYWQLCIADDASTDPSVLAMLNSYSQIDSRIQIVFRQQNGHISAASNTALELVSGDWVALLDHDDVLPEHALFWIADAINKNPAASLIYSDEDKIDEAGKRIEPYFKCDWNVDLFYSHNLISHLGVYRTELLRSIGGFRIGFEGSQDYDLALRYIEKINHEQIIHLPRVLYHWRLHKKSAALKKDIKPYALMAGRKALQEHFSRQEITASVELLDFGMYRVRYSLPVPEPLVSLIIPTRNGLDLLRQCVDSILGKTNYHNYEVLIVDNGSDDLDILNYFKSLSQQNVIRIIRDERPFNFSALNNLAVTHARGELIGLINNDIEVISPNWLTELVSHALRPGIGAVGARLWYPNNTLQHGGVILGLGGVAGHPNRGMPMNSKGYFGRASVIQSFSAVTAACLVVRKSIYEQVGGLNETDLSVAFNDVDFCLRLIDAGYRNIWTPFAELYHHESASRGLDNTPEKQQRFNDEVEYMKHKWGSRLLNDPAYNPNLTLSYGDFSLAYPPRLDFINNIST
jgi:glycosyltransferase involved in cell wall biosynthesis